MSDNEYIRLVQHDGQWHMLLADYYDDNNLNPVRMATPFKADVPREKVVEWCYERELAAIVL